MNTTTRMLLVAGIGVGLLAGCGGSGSAGDGAATAPPVATDGGAVATTVGGESAAAPATAAPGAYVSPDGYSVNFPGEPSTASEMQPMLGLEIEMRTASYSSVSSNYAVTVADMSVASENGGPTTLDDQLDGVVSGVMQGSGGTLKNSESVTIDGRPARRYEFELTSGSTTLQGVGLAVSDGMVLYQPIALTDDAAAAAAFVDSFHLID